jgi:hypothetical protein
VADANLCFIPIDVGAYGHENDSSVFSNSSFGKVFSSGDLNVPPMRNIPGTSISIPLYFVGDEAFPLKPNMKRLFPRRELDLVQNVFNDKLSSTRHTIQCAFGSLTKEFGIFQKAFETNVQVTECTIKSARIVYSYIRKKQTTEIKQREEDILKQEQQTITPSVEHTTALDVLAMKHYRCKRS